MHLIENVAKSVPTINKRLMCNGKMVTVLNGKMCLMVKVANDKSDSTFI